MKKYYLKFYEQQTRKLNQEHFKNMDLINDPYLLVQEDQVILKSKYLIGKIDHKKTFGFLRQEIKDIYIEGDRLLDSMHDDIVIVEDGFLPSVVEVIERALHTLVATVNKQKDDITYTSDVYIDRELIVESEIKVASGHVVKLHVTKISKKTIEAKVVEILGHINDPDIETLKIVASYEWPKVFKKEILDAANHIQIDHEKEKKERLDLTNTLVFTIDGADAKDLDDAISIYLKDDLYHLGVHIADVSHYIEEDSILDKEALKRGTSAYLADRVIPMLPHTLSNDLCSLNPHEEKYTLSCMMVIDQEAKVVSYDIKKTIIKSNHRLTYDQVNALLKENKSLKNEDLDKALIHANELSQKLQVMRRKRGEIEFESSELGFIVDQDGRVIDVYERKSDVAENLIESLMLVANETVAEHMHFSNLPSIYRIHEKPDIEKLRSALITIQKLGVPVQLKKMGNPKVLQMMTKQSASSPFSYVVHMTLLRAMQKAIYTSYQDIHFGLGARYYTHFTSPIRRYPDLILHRLIHRFVLGETKAFKKDFKHFEALLPDVAKQSSDQERKAVQMERDVAKLKSVEFMQDKIEQTFQAMITQMMPSGMFVKLENGIEGFVPLKALNDYYHYNENMLAYIGSRGVLYKLGMTVTVKLINVDLQAKKMDFMIINKKEKNKRRKS